MQLERVGELTKGQLAIKPALTQFNGGEISPQLEGRFDWDKYAYSAKVCKNFIPQVEGGLKRRGGSHFVSLSRQPEVVRFYIKVNFSDNTSVPPDVTIDMGENGKIEYKNSDYFPTPELKLPSSAPEGTLIEYVVSAEGYGVGKGSFEVEKDIVEEVSLVKITDGATLTVETDPVGGIVYINGIKTNDLFVPKNTDIDVIVKFGNNYEYRTANISKNTTMEVSLPIPIFESDKAGVTYLTVEDAAYDVILVGAGGGGSGGSWGDDRKSAGGGGGGGAYFNGRLRLSGKIKITIGEGGYGGKATEKTGQRGGTGGYSSISVDRDGYKFVVVADGGRCGDWGWGDVVTLDQGKGGKVYTYEATQDLIESTDASLDGYGDEPNMAKGAESRYKNYGVGGNGYMKGNGTAGVDGYIRILYKGRYK